MFYSIAAKVLNRADLGLVSTLTFLHFIFTIIAPLALPIAGTKYVSEYIGKQKRNTAASIASTVIRVVLVLSLVFLVVFIGVSYLLVSVFQWPHDALIFLTVIFISSFLATMRLTYLSLMQGLQLFDKYAISNVLTIIFTRLTGLILIILNYGLTGFVIGMAFGEGLGLILSMFYYRGALPKAKKPYDSRLLLKFSLPIYVMGVLTAFSEWIDRALFLLLSHNLESLGVYELAIRGAGSLSVVWALIDVIILPVFSETYGDKGKSELPQLLKKALRYLVFLYFPAAIGLASISKTAMALLFGWEYTIGSVPLTILSFFSILTAFRIIMGSTLKSIGQTIIFAKAAFISIIANGLTVILLTPLFGLYGAVVGRVIAVIVVFLCIFYELRHTINVKIDLEGLWKGALAATSIIVPLQLFETYISGNTINNPAFSICIEILVGLGFYVLALYLLRALNREDFNVFKQIMPKSFLKIIVFFEKILVR
jgi:O-antigen/teichoic acid export membrane protein